MYLQRSFNSSIVSDLDSVPCDLTETGAAVILLQAPQLWPCAFSPSASRLLQHRPRVRGPPLSLSANPNHSYYANLNTPRASSDVICLLILFYFCIIQDLGTLSQILNIVKTLHRQTQHRLKKLSTSHSVYSEGFSIYKSIKNMCRHLK